jgi:Flp pilus assembly protein TadB
MDSKEQQQQKESIMLEMEFLKERREDCFHAYHLGMDQKRHDEIILTNMHVVAVTLALGMATILVSLNLSNYIWVVFMALTIVIAIFTIIHAVKWRKKGRLNKYMGKFTDMVDIIHDRIMGNYQRLGLDVDKWVQKIGVED